MKNKSIRFFSLQDNTEAKPKKQSKQTVAKAKPVKLEGYVSPTGKLVIPAKTYDQLDFSTDLATIKVGTDEGKRKVRTLYLFPTDSQDEGFELVKAAKSYTVSLDYILKKGGVDYDQSKYNFTLLPFKDQTGNDGYVAKLTSDKPKPTYTGKPRGRKPKAEIQE